MHLKKITLLKVKYLPVTYLCSIFFANLRVLTLSQKHGDDQILHDFATTYEICISEQFYGL